MRGSTEPPSALYVAQAAGDGQPQQHEERRDHDDAAAGDGDDDGDQRVAWGGGLVDRQAGQELGLLGERPPGHDRRDGEGRGERASWNRRRSTSPSAETPAAPDTITAGSPGPAISSRYSGWASRCRTPSPAKASRPATVPAPSARRR